MRVRERNAYMSYLRSGLYSLYDCYNSFSSPRALMLRARLRRTNHEKRRYFEGHY